MPLVISRTFGRTGLQLLKLANSLHTVGAVQFWLRFLRLKTMETISKIDCSSTFYWLLGNWDKKLKSSQYLEWYPLSLTANISVKTLSNWTCRGHFGIVMKSRFMKKTWKTSNCKLNRADCSMYVFFLDKILSAAGDQEK